MGSKHALSNGNEPEELTQLLAAFEWQDNVQMTLTLSLQKHNGKMDLQGKAVAWAKAQENGDLPHLVLANVIRWGSESVTLMGLLFGLLYAVDFELAEREWNGLKPPEA